MLKVMSDPKADAIYVYFTDGPSPVAYTKELDDNRAIDYSIDDNPIGVGFLNVSLGVNTDDLPNQKEIEKFLVDGMGLKLFA